MNSRGAAIAETYDLTVHYIKYGDICLGTYISPMQLSICLNWVSKRESLSNKQVDTCC